MRSGIRQDNLSNIKKHCEDIANSFARLSLELGDLIDLNEENTTQTVAQATALADCIQQSVAIASKVEAQLKKSYREIKLKKRNKKYKQNLYIQIFKLLKKKVVLYSYKIENGI